MSLFLNVPENLHSHKVAKKANFSTTMEDTTENIVSLARKVLFIHYFLPECLLVFFCLNFNIFTMAVPWSLEINVINLAMWQVTSLALKYVLLLHA